MSSIFLSWIFTRQSKNVEKLLPKRAQLFLRKNIIKFCNKILFLFSDFAFYSQLSTSITNGYVVFNNCKTNEGSAYNEMTGIFTCKYSGTYAFSWTIATSGHRYTEAELLVNDEVIGSSGTDSRPSRDTADTSTGFVACNLGVGDKVRIRVNGTADGNYSTFSGWRLPDGKLFLFLKQYTQMLKHSHAIIDVFL